MQWAEITGSGMYWKVLPRVNYGTFVNYFKILESENCVLRWNKSLDKLEHIYCGETEKSVELS